MPHLVRKNDVEFLVSECNDFWRNQFTTTWEDGTFRVFDTYLSKDYDYIDIGAWIGPTVLYAASKARRVYGAEPDRLAFATLRDNIALNPELNERIQLHEAAVSSTTEEMKLFYSGDNGGNSVSSMLPVHTGYYNVQCLAFADFISRGGIDINAVNFVKIDIEGGEFDLVETMVDYLIAHDAKPSVYLSVHMHFLRKMLRKKSHWFGFVKKRLAIKESKKRAEKMIEKLSIYKYCYDTDGNTVHDILDWIAKHPNEALLFTDRIWPN